MGEVEGHKKIKDLDTIYNTKGKLRRKHKNQNKTKKDSVVR